MRTPQRWVASDGTVTWRVRFREGVSPKTGRPLQTSETFDDEREALRFAALIQRMRAREALRQIDLEYGRDQGPTLDELAEEFFDWKATRVRSDRTVADYRRDYRNWIKPELGSRPAASITESDVQALVDRMEARKLKPKSVADRHAILHGVYKWASAPSRRLVPHNPCTETDLPKRRRTQPKGLRPAEWQALHSALKSIDADAADLAEFMLASGWRWSEAAAVDVVDVEDDGQTVHVYMGQVIRRDAAGRHVIVADAKADASMRRIRLDSSAAEMVRRRVGSRTAGLVFANRGGRQWHYANFLNRAWKPAVEAASLERRPSPHWLRHTAVAWMVLSGKVSLPELQRRIGHEHISTTIDVYGRLVDDVSAEALDAFEAMRHPSRQLESQSSQSVDNP
jgi:site-specific recombinase XerD